MKIAVVGCGALGSYYGGKLAQQSQDVHFLLRSDYQVVKENGVKIIEPGGTFTVRPHAANDPRQIGPVDVVLIGLKTTANSEFPRLLPPLINGKTAVVTLQNGLGNEEQLTAVCAPEQILGGLCFVCLNRIAPGTVHHMAHGQVVLGEFQGPPCERTHTIAAQFNAAGVACTVTDSLARVHWEKLVWNIPFNGLGVAGAAGLEAVLTGEVSPGAQIGPCLTTDTILGDEQWAGVARDLMLETIHAAQKLGYAVPESVADFQIQRTRTMGAYKASTLIDFERGQPLELESMFLEPLRRAKGAGVKTPRLQALCSVLEAIASKLPG